VEPTLLAIGVQKLRAWADLEPRLAHYRHEFDRLELMAPHIRSAEVEEILGIVGDPFSTANATHSILTNSEMAFKPAVSSTGEEYEVAQGTVGALTTDADRELRRTAWENYADAHLALKNTQANCIITGVKQLVFKARARNYHSALEAAVGANTIPPEVIHNLIETFKKNLPTWHRYWKIRAKAMGLEKLHEYDVKAPLTANKPHVSYQQAVDWICEGMAPLGEEYVSTLRKGCLEDRWVDIYPNKGKGAGAYSAGAPGTSPYIFMSYNDDLFSMSTLAHELGHSLHSYNTWQHQPLVYSDYTIFVAEVASNFNQALVRDYLFRTQTDRDFQIAVIEEAMANFHRYFFIMPTLARFEVEVHQRVENNQPLTADILINLMADLFTEAYGDGVVVDRARTGITWAEFSTHLYMNFYVYQYATGISGAHALAGKILAGEEGAAERYLEFLRAGSSLFPLDVLKRAGVDLTTPAPVEETFAVLAALVDRLEALVA
jgi:oligoendopeptidase F